MDEIRPPSIPLKDTKEVTCTCGSAVFQQFLSLREVSAIITGTGKNEIVPMAMICCAKCHKRFEPPQIITPA
jgi:hypothetical protein